MSRVFDAAQIGANETTLLAPANAVYNNLQAFTFAAWIYQTTADSFAAIFVKDPQVSYGQFLSLSSQSLFVVSVYSTTQASSQSNETVPLNTWTHVAATFDKAGDAKIHLYINGVEATYLSQDAAVGTISDNSANGWMTGNDTFDDGFTGRIAEQAIWNTALTSGQIATLAASTTGASAIQTANLVGYWHDLGTNSPEPDSTANGDDAVLSVNPPLAGPNSPGYSPAAGPATRLYTTGPASSVEDTPFSVTLLSTDNFDVPSPVTQDTNVLISVFAGTGTVFGTITGTILAGQSTATISGVLYNTVENNVQLWTASTSGDSLAPFLNGTTINFTAITYYSEPDCRNYATFPNSSRNVNGTLTYDVQTSSNPAVPGTDSRAAGPPVASGTYPQNTRTPGLYGPNEP